MWQSSLHDVMWHQDRVPSVVGCSAPVSCCSHDPSTNSPSTFPPCSPAHSSLSTRRSTFTSHPTSYQRPKMHRAAFHARIASNGSSWAHTCPQARCVLARTSAFSSGTLRTNQWNDTIPSKPYVRLSSRRRHSAIIVEFYWNMSRRISRRLKMLLWRLCVPNSLPAIPGWGIIMGQRTILVLWRRMTMSCWGARLIICTSDTRYCWRRRVCTQTSPSWSAWQTHAWTQVSIIVSVLFARGGRYMYASSLSLFKWRSRCHCRIFKRCELLFLHWMGWDQCCTFLS